MLLALTTMNIISSNFDDEGLVLSSGSEENASLSNDDEDSLVLDLAGDTVARRMGLQICLVCLMSECWAGLTSSANSMAEM